MPKRSFDECFFHFEADAAEMGKIDNTIRLAGLKLPMGKRVIGRTHADLIVALGASDIGRNCTGTQLLVVARLCILYEAIVETYIKYPYLDINSDYFFEEALAGISENYPSISNQTPTRKTDAVQDTPPVQPHGAQPNDSGSETFIGQDLMEPSAAATHKRARIQLEELVRDWMAVRAIARRKQAKADKPKTAAVSCPEQQPGESNKAYILRPQKECECYVEENEMYEKEVSRETKKHDDLYDDYNADSEWRREESEMQEKHVARIDRMQDTIDRQSDEIDELKQRLSVAGDSWVNAHGRPEQRGGFPGARGGPRGRGGFTGFPGF
ncbi:hypothetical protein INS49_003854 [Diaporthe citri]|uniref:uncharacterized protein n=1 Tax=Diaporthe citri TaxID=83186 RepID=UPI001C7F034B|nr:uncharacterized protein INS49_003854 [Diaporthe citri]KAG6354773.1 hypothetical protein INS49_003854 [Diaporthe citri]